MGGWRSLFIGSVGGLLLWKAVIRAVSEQYYDNHSLLLPDEEVELEHGAEFALLLVELYNCLEGAVPGWAAIDLAAVRTAVEALAPGVVAEQVACARAAMLQPFEEPEAAWDVVQPHVSRSLERLASGRKVRAGND